MTRKIAVIVRDRQGEALRMALGLTLMDDTIHVYLVDKRFDLSEADSTNIEMMKELDVEFFTNNQGNEDAEHVSTEKMARKLTDYDHVIPY
ncbi:MAG: hypothetical protein FVQ81_09555 [Candidatus Glassbacteria bacterium]|nr:hypothetical protein [Candidatus Glassbacteria bacterium]